MGEGAEPRAGRITIRDVSRAAGVSIKTVSRVINSNGYVATATRARVEAVVASLRFQPNAAARALSGGRSYQIALICDNPSPWYVYEMQAGVRERCQRAGVRLLAQPYDRGSAGLVEDVVSLVHSARPDGMILTPVAADDPRLLEELARLAVPVVRVQPGTDADRTPSVFIDNIVAAKAVTEHLLGLGHRRIGFIQGPPAYRVSQERLAGFRSAHGDPPDQALIRPGAFDIASGAAAAEALLDSADPPTAIFATNDAMAAGALAAAHRRGIAVPERLSIAGFDDADFSTIVWPPLTTVHQPIRELGAVAADMLLEPTGGPPQRRLEAPLVIRGTTAAAAG